MFPFRTASKRTVPLRSLISLALFTCAASIALAAPEDGPYTDEDGGELGVPTKSINCDALGRYCLGTYEELIEWVRIYDTGHADIRPTIAVRNHIVAKEFCDLSSSLVLDIPADRPGGETIIHQMTVALVLGKRFRLQWIGDEVTNECRVNNIISYP